MGAKLTAGAHGGVVADQSLPVRWPEYVPPSSAVSALAQMPSYRIDGYSLSDAIMRDWRAYRRRALTEDQR